MTRVQKLLKEIEELLNNHFQKLKEYNQKELKREAKEEVEKFEKEIKNKILSDLPSWALDPEGFFYRVDGGLKSLNLSGIVSKCGGVICLGNKDYRNEIVNGFINEITQNPQDWRIKRAKPEETVYGTHWVVEHKSGRKHYKPDFSQIASFSDEEWAKIKNALNHNRNSVLIIRKCGFSDCEKRISWEKTECNNCWNRKENYVCDACGQKQSYNISYLIGIRDNLNDTEIALQRVRGLIAKLPKFREKLKEVEKSLILTTEEKQAIEKTKLFRTNFVREKSHRQQRDNIHLFKLCRWCLNELSEKDKNFTSENPDIEKIREKWDEFNPVKHSEIFRQIAEEIGEEEWKKICDENDKELGLRVEEEKNSEKEKLSERDWPCPAYQEEGVWEMMEERIKGENGKEEENKPKKNDNDQQKRDSYDNLSKKEIIEEIKKVKSEIEELKNSKDDSQQYSRKLQQKEEKLKKLERRLTKFKVDNNSQKTNNKDNSKKVFYGIGAISLIVLVISMLVVWVKKK